MPRCYVCDTPAGKYSFAVNEVYSIIQCHNCGLEYTSPVPTDEQLERFYSNYSDVRADIRIVELNARSHLDTLSQFGWTSESRVLDFGAGKGTFVDIAGDNCYGVEIGHSNNLRIKGSIEESAEGFEKWDFITMWGVLEHLPNPKQILSCLSTHLRSGGFVALTTVNAEGLMPYYFKPPEHLSYWTSRSFKMLADECNLRVVKEEPYNMNQLSAIYLDRLLSRTPKEYQALFSAELPEVVKIPTNEVLVVFEKPR